MPRAHEDIVCSDNSKIKCECEECWAEDMRDKYPDLLKDYSAKEIAETWCAYSEQSCASWLFDDRETVLQVFHQRNKWLESGKSDSYYWRTGRFFK